MELVSRHERRLIRQRGAGTRELRGVDFGFSFGAFPASETHASECEVPKDDVDARPSLDRAAADADPEKNRRKTKPEDMVKTSNTGNDRLQRRTRRQTGAARPKTSLDADGLGQVRAAASLVRAARPPRTRHIAKATTKDVSEPESVPRELKRKAPARRGRPKKKLPEQKEDEAFEDPKKSLPAGKSKLDKSVGSKAKPLDAKLPVESHPLRPPAPFPEAEPEADDFKDAVEFQSRGVIASSSALDELDAVENQQAPRRAQADRPRRIVSSGMPITEQIRRERRAGGSPEPASDQVEANSESFKPRKELASANKGSLSERPQKRVSKQSQRSASKKQKLLAVVPEDSHMIAEGASESLDGHEGPRKSAVQSPKAVLADRATEAQYPPGDTLNVPKARSGGRTNRSGSHSTTSSARTRQYTRPHDLTAEEPGDLASILRRYGDPKIPARLTANVDTRLNFRF